MHLLVDTGADINIIKLQFLKNDLFIDETNKVYIRGISQQLIHTIGRINIPIIINNEEINVTFEVVGPQFPLLKHGILGKVFLIESKAIIDIANNTLVLTNHDNKETIKNCYTINARSESIIKIPIKNTEVHNKCILIQKQELSQDLLCSESLTHVKDGYAIISILNISEANKKFTDNEINKLIYNNENDYEILTFNIEMDNNNRIDKIKKLIKVDHMTKNEKETIINICEKYSDVFFLEGDKLTCTNTIEHSIKLKPDAKKPIHQRQFRLPFSQQTEINRQINKMLDNDIIQPSLSGFNAPLILVKKKLDNSGVQKYRIVVDFRKLNDATIDEVFPLPNINEILDRLGNCTMFSVIDLTQGFYQIPLSQDSREFTAFSTLEGHWEFKRMTMGMKQSPAIFQKLMTNVLSGLTPLKVMVYLDDILIFSRSLNEHANKLSEVFSRLKSHNLKIEPHKCNFLKREILYLGHKITSEGIKPDETKIQAVLNYPPPKTVKQIKSFLGLSGYYRKFIQNYSAIAKPLTTLLCKDVKFNWTEECQRSFDTLRTALCKHPILKYPDFEKKFYLTTDASGKALGAILSQIHDGKDFPVGYASRTLNKAESNYSTIETELLGIIFGVKFFKHYLLDTHFIIITDHQPLVYLMNLKNPLSRLARWKYYLLEYNFSIQYKAGSTNKADALTRMYTINEIIENTYENFIKDISTKLITNNNIKETSENLLDTNPEYHIVSEISKHYNFKEGINYKIKQKFGINQSLPDSKLIGDIRYFKNNDRFIIFIITKNRDKQPTSYENIYVALINLKRFCIDNNINKLVMNKLGQSDSLKYDTIRAMIRYIFRKTAIEINICAYDNYTQEQKLDILNQFHYSLIGGHLGINKTLKRIKHNYNWLGMRKDVEEFIKNCESCQKNKISNKHTRQPLAITSTASRPFEKIFLDIVGPLTPTFSGNNYILTMMCDLTKYSIGTPIPNHTANTVAEAFVTHFITTHSIPNEILTDQGTEFLSKTFTEVCKLLKIKKLHTSPFRPQSNGTLERSHRTLGEYLRHYVDKKLDNWDILLPYAFFVYNSTEHSVTKYQPYELVYGKRLEIPIKLKLEPEPRYNYDDYIYEIKQNMQEAHKIARERLINNKHKTKERYDLKENPLDINVGDFILLKQNAHRTKLESLWLGPYEVLDIINEHNIIIKKGRKSITVHKNNVKIYHNN